MSKFQKPRWWKQTPGFKDLSVLSLQLQGTTCAILGICFWKSMEKKSTKKKIIQSFNNHLKPAWLLTPHYKRMYNIIMVSRGRSDIYILPFHDRALPCLNQSNHHHVVFHMGLDFLYCICCNWECQGMHVSYRSSRWEICPHSFPSPGQTAMALEAWLPWKMRQHLEHNF